MGEAVGTQARQQAREVAVQHHAPIRQREALPVPDERQAIGQHDVARGIHRHQYASSTPWSCARLSMPVDAPSCWMQIEAAALA